jgi:sulfoxide reductase heme-binding subunit YedZ
MARRLADVGRRFRQIPKLVLYVAGVVPGLWALHLGLSDQLGSEPINQLERILGLWALRFLLASLAITPLRRLAGLDLLAWRRPLGLLSFFYAVAHLAVYIALDHGFAFAAIWADVLKRPYVTLGAFAFLALTPLALTSNDASVRLLGGAPWRRLHHLAYPAAAAAALHFLLLVKSWPPQALAYAAATAVLLIYRIAQAGKARREIASFR